MSEIHVDDEGLRNETDALMGVIASLELPELCASTEATVASLQFIPNLYNAFRDFVNSYIKILSRDVATVTDIALEFIDYDDAYANCSSDVIWYPEVERQLDASIADFACPPAEHFNSEWIINTHDLDLMISEVLDRLASLMDKLEGESGLASTIQSLVTTQYFTGDAATATLNYLSTNHLSSAYGLYSCAFAITTYLSNFWNLYAENPMFQSSEGLECQFCKFELERLYNSLVEKEEYAISLFPTLDTAIEQAYSDSGYVDDYSSQTPSGFAYVNGFANPKQKIQNAINTVDYNEWYLANITASRIEASFTPLLTLLRQIIEHGSRYDYSFPPDPAHSQIDVETANSSFGAMMEYNSYVFQNDIDTAWTRANTINTEVALENRRAQLQGAIVSNAIGITIAIVSLVLTCGADAPIAITTIALCSESIYIATHGSDLIEDSQDLYYVCQGDLNADSVNLLCDYGLAFYPEDGIESIGLPSRRDIYDGIESCNDVVYSVVVPTANYTGVMPYGAQLTRMGTRAAVRYTVNGVITYVCPEAAGMITYCVMIPINGAIDSTLGFSVTSENYWVADNDIFTNGSTSSWNSTAYNMLDSWGVSGNPSPVASGARPFIAQDTTNGYTDPLSSDGENHITPNDPVINQDNLR